MSVESSGPSPLLCKQRKIGGQTLGQEVPMVQYRNSSFERK